MFFFLHSGSPCDINHKPIHGIMNTKCRLWIFGNPLLSVNLLLLKMKNDQDQSAAGRTGLSLTMRAGVPLLPLWRRSIGKMFEITGNTYPIKLGLKTAIWFLSCAHAVWGHAIAQPCYWSRSMRQQQPAPADPATKSLAGFAVETVPIIQWAIWAPAANQSQGNWLRAP